MSNFTSKLITTLIDKGHITELFRCHVEEAVNKLLQIELTEFLNYDRYDRIASIQATVAMAFMTGV